MMETATTLSLWLLGVAGLLVVRRLVVGSSLADRVVALEALLVVVVASIAVGSVRRGSGDFLNVLVVASLVSFVAPVTVARFLERRGAGR